MCEGASMMSTERETIVYRPIDAHLGLDPIDMHVQRGDQIALLTPVADADRYDVVVLAEIVDTLDTAWDFYAEMTGQEPTLITGREIDGLGTIAVVPHTCTSDGVVGAGCGFLGETGIEIRANPYFDEWLHDTVATDNQYDQILFYELGRNFWFYDDQLKSLEFTKTGFAVANRFLSMEAIGVEAAPYDQSQPFDEFTTSLMDDTSQFYLADDSLNWENTALAGTLVHSPHRRGD